MNSLDPPPTLPQARAIPGPPARSVPAQWYGKTRLERLAFEQVATALSAAHSLACQSVVALCAVSAERADGFRAFRGINAQIDRMNDLQNLLVKETAAFSAWLQTQGEPIASLEVARPIVASRETAEAADVLQDSIASHVERVRSSGPATVNRVSDHDEPRDANQIGSAYP